MATSPYNRRNNPMAGKSGAMHGAPGKPAKSMPMPMMPKGKMPMPSPMPKGRRG
jgi:hypothetical protein